MKARHPVCLWLLISAPLIFAPLWLLRPGRPSRLRWDVSTICPIRSRFPSPFHPDVETTGAFRQSVCATLRTRLEQTFGATWILSPGTDVVVDTRLTPADTSGLERKSYTSAAARLANVACDKAYFLSVCRDGTQWQVAGREWDRTLQTLGAIALEQTDERRRVPDTALAVIMRLFSPLVIINDADRDSKSALLTVRAGSIPFGDPKFAPLKPGDILEPVFRFFDSKRNLRGIQSVPWTYLVLGTDAIEHGQVKATVVSSYRATAGCQHAPSRRSCRVQSPPRLFVDASENRCRPRAGPPAGRAVCHRRRAAARPARRTARCRGKRRKEGGGPARPPPTKKKGKRRCPARPCCGCYPIVGAT